MVLGPPTLGALCARLGLLIAAFPILFQSGLLVLEFNGVNKFDTELLSAPILQELQGHGDNRWV